MANAITVEETINHIESGFVVYSGWTGNAIFSGSTDLSSIFSSPRTTEEEIKYQKQEKERREKNQWIAENVYTRTILFEKYKKPYPTIYSGVTNLYQILGNV